MDVKEKETRGLHEKSCKKRGEKISEKVGGRAYSGLCSPRDQECKNWIRDLTLKEDCQREWIRYKKRKRQAVLLCLLCGTVFSAVALAGSNRDLAFRLLGLTALLCFLFPIAMDSHLKDRVRKRQDQMAEDYPVIVLKLSLCLQAGMSLRRAWEAVVSGYVQGERKEMRYAYEEMGLTLSDIQNGHAESRAYGEFGRRCKGYSYMKLGCLLEQNLKLGGDSLTAFLAMEMEDAFAQRQNQALRKGQEAQSKLLFPMMVLLIISLAVVLAPAFLSIW